MSEIDFIQIYTTTAATMKPRKSLLYSFPTLCDISTCQWQLARKSDQAYNTHMSPPLPNLPFKSCLPYTDHTQDRFVHSLSHQPRTSIFRHDVLLVLSRPPPASTAGSFPSAATRTRTEKVVAASLQVAQCVVLQSYGATMA